jgi:hypothetical protein
MIAHVTDEMVWNQIVACAWCDEDLMRRLLEEPEAVLAENDVEIPRGMRVEVVLGCEVKVEEFHDTRRFILPAGPSHELIEEDLAGGAVAYCYSAACGRCAACGCRCYCSCRC